MYVNLVNRDLSHYFRVTDKAGTCGKLIEMSSLYARGEISREPIGSRLHRLRRCYPPNWCNYFRRPEFTSGIISSAGRAGSARWPKSRKRSGTAGPFVPVQTKGRSRQAKRQNRQGRLLARAPPALWRQLYLLGKVISSRQVAVALNEHPPKNEHRIVRRRNLCHRCLSKIRKDLN